MRLCFMCSAYTKEKRGCVRYRTKGLYDWVYTHREGKGFRVEGLGKQHMEDSTTIIQAFFGKYTKRTYKRGEIILREGDTPSGLMYVAQGYVRMYRVAENGSMQMGHIFKPGAFFPMMWVLNNTANEYCYEAMTAVTIWRAPKEAAKAFLRENPEIVLEFASRLLAGIEGMLTRMGYLMVEEAYKKLVLLLLYYTKNFAEQTPAGLAIVIPLTHKEISGWIGTTRETASVQIEQLKKKGLILYKGRQLIIPDLLALQKESVN